MALVTPQSKLVDIIDYQLQNGDINDRIQSLEEISSYVTHGQHDSTSYHAILNRHADANYESDPYVRAEAFNAISEILHYELEHNIRPNPHLAYLDVINDALENEDIEVLLDSALSCYSTLLSKPEYSGKITMGISRIEEGLVKLFSNKHSTMTQYMRAQESLDMLEHFSKEMAHFNDSAINFGIRENLDPEEKKNLTLFAEIEEFRERTKNEAETRLGKFKLKGEFDGQKTFVEVPKEALDQIELDMLNYRSTKFEDIRVLENGIVIAEGCQPS